MLLKKLTVIGGEDITSLNIDFGTEVEDKDLDSLLITDNSVNDGKRYYPTISLIGKQSEPIYSLYNTFNFLSQIPDMNSGNYKEILSTVSGEVMYELLFNSNGNDCCYSITVSKNGIHQEELYENGFNILYESEFSDSPKAPKNVLGFLKTFNCFNLDISKIEDSRINEVITNATTYSDYFDYLKNLLKQYDVIYDIDIEEDILVIKADENAIWIPLAKADDTIKILTVLFGEIVMSMNSNMIFIINGLDKHLDIFSQCALLKTFNNEEKNECFSQMIFTTKSDNIEYRESMTDDQCLVVETENTTKELYISNVSEG